MGNKLFQLAKEAVHLAETSTNSAALQAQIDKAKNSISSAFANSTSAEQLQLQELQQRLDELQNNLK